MTAIQIHDRLGALVAKNPQMASLFENLGIDYCCGGSQSLEEAAVEKGLDPATVARMLEAGLKTQAAGREAATLQNPSEFDTPKLIDYIVSTHHAYVKRELPRLVSLGTKVAEAHGSKKPELFELKSLIDQLDKELRSHLIQEETVLFPKLLAFPTTRQSAKDLVSPLIDDHREVGALLAVMKRAVDDYEVPEWACNTYRALIQALRDFEEDLHRHVHLENNVLFERIR